MQRINLKNEIRYDLLLPFHINRDNINNGENINIAILDTGIDTIYDNIRQCINFSSTDRTKWIDKTGHGTFVYYIIAGNNMIKGFANRANIYIVKVLDNNRHGTVHWLVRGIEWCIDNNIDVVNISLGFKEGGNALHNICKTAYMKNITLVAAAGNKGNIEYPAIYDEVFCVKDINSIMPIQKSFALAADGKNVISAIGKDQYAVDSGSSFSAAKITGAIASIQSYMKQKYGCRMTNEELINFMKNNMNYFNNL